MMISLKCHCSNRHCSALGLQANEVQAKAFPLLSVIFGAFQEDEHFTCKKRMIPDALSTISIISSTGDIRDTSLASLPIGHMWMYRYYL